MNRGSNEAYFSFKIQVKQRQLVKLVKPVKLASTIHLSIPWLIRLITSATPPLSERVAGRARPLTRARGERERSQRRGGD